MKSAIRVGRKGSKPWQPDYAPIISVVLLQPPKLIEARATHQEGLFGRETKVNICI